MIFFLLGYVDNWRRHVTSNARARVAVFLVKSAGAAEAAILVGGEKNERDPNGFLFGKVRVTGRCMILRFRQDKRWSTLVFDLPIHRVVFRFAG